MSKLEHTIFIPSKIYSVMWHIPQCSQLIFLLHTLAFSVLCVMSWTNELPDNSFMISTSASYSQRSSVSLCYCQDNLCYWAYTVLYTCDTFMTMCVISKYDRFYSEINGNFGCPQNRLVSLLIIQCIIYIKKTSKIPVITKWLTWGSELWRLFPPLIWHHHWTKQQGVVSVKRAVPNQWSRLRVSERNILHFYP